MNAIGMAGLLPACSCLPYVDCSQSDQPANKMCRQHRILQCGKQAGVKQGAVRGDVGADQPLGCLMHSAAGAAVDRQMMPMMRGNANRTRRQAAPCKQAHSTSDLDVSLGTLALHL